jgi:hypothetical protein
MQPWEIHPALIHFFDPDEDLARPQSPGEER